MKRLTHNFVKVNLAMIIMTRKKMQIVMMLMITYKVEQLLLRFEKTYQSSIFVKDHNLRLGKNRGEIKLQMILMLENCNPMILKFTTFDF